MGPLLLTFSQRLSCDNISSSAPITHSRARKVSFSDSSIQGIRISIFLVAAHPQTQKIKEEWEEDPSRSQRNKIYLEETCIEWLQKQLSYQKEAPQRIEPPVGKVTHKVVNDRLEVLTCQAFGFYPKEIQATWRRDGEVWKDKTLPRNVAPNSNGTYYVWLSIDIDTKERDSFECHLKHEGLQEPLVLDLKEETGERLWGCEVQK
ncbi:hypothetical protein E2320_014276 [Naja naja]|nr:hypothetical protein E2320_014276 [Naja naja]